MSEVNIFNKIKFTTEEYQQERLAEIQLLHHEVLEEQGLIDVALGVGVRSGQISDLALESMNGFTTACVHVTPGTDGEGYSRLTYKLRFDTPFFTSEDKLCHYSTFVNVAHYYPAYSSVQTEDGFNDEQAELLVKLADELRWAKIRGLTKPRDNFWGLEETYNLHNQQDM